MFLASRPVAHALIGQNPEFADIDGAYAALLGIAVDAVAGRSILDVTHSDDRDAVMTLFQQVWDDDASLSATQRHLDPDGQPIWVKLRVSRLGIGARAGFVVTCRPLPAPEAPPSTVEAQWQMARLLLQAINGGKQAFGETLIGNPATEILLLSYLAEAEARALQAGEIAAEINVSWPLTQRWLLALANAGFVESELPGAIRHETPVRLTPRALAMIEAIFGALVAVVQRSLVPA